MSCKSRRRHRRHVGLVRALKVLLALSQSRFGLTIDELREKVDCSRRTLYRYLTAIQEAGFRTVVAVRPTGEHVRRVEQFNGQRSDVA